jgi:hypothetical protein
METLCSASLGKGLSGAPAEGARRAGRRRARRLDTRCPAPTPRPTPKPTHQQMSYTARLRSRAVLTPVGFWPAGVSGMKRMWVQGREEGAGGLEPRRAAVAQLGGWGVGVCGGGWGGRPAGISGCAARLPLVFPTHWQRSSRRRASGHPAIQQGLPAGTVYSILGSGLPLCRCCSSSCGWAGGQAWQEVGKQAGRGRVQAFVGRRPCLSQQSAGNASTYTPPIQPPSPLTHPLQLCGQHAGAIYRHRQHVAAAWRQLALEQLRVRILLCHHPIPRIQEQRAHHLQQKGESVATRG